MSDQPPLPPGAESLSVVLPHKPSASLSCTSIKGTANILIVFLNGLGLPQSHWWPCITQFLSLDHVHPSILTYDRYGQGLTTDPDPQDDGGQSSLPPGHRHDIVSITKDLHVLIEIISTNHQLPLSETPLIFVANSIGCPLARYYSQTYPSTVAGLILLDSYMTDTNFIDLYPDPDALGFDEHSLPDGITIENIRAAREGMGKLFHPRVTNKEGFWRGNITLLLPHSYEPKLLGWRQDDGGKGPYLTVVGHDWDVFAEESLRMKGMTKAVAMAYTNPAWGLYNEGLVRITSEERGRRLIAARAGHFIQQGRPDLVAEQVETVVILVAEELKTTD
ncbi:uncharacterized protein DFL_005712 [Arthrobotrys flagrans]|uniref:AB hydrolase-1 domain-containing protein n=1 Tax=Arthrobotrys flagrans TaxID=97331 RepID=A0A436ZY71_ARTFL|nr:hypothetical protein DFL_005712 [Arthrobotrys flagrans]